MEQITETAEPLFNFSLFGWPYTGLVTLFALGVYFVLGYMVGVARRKYSVSPPHTQGPEEFMRVFRTHQNTLEYMVLFLPLLWMAALSSSDEMAASIGVFWPIARIFYATAYFKETKKRFKPFLANLLILGILFILVAFQMVNSLLYFQSN